MRIFNDCRDAFYQIEQHYYSLASFVGRMTKNGTNSVHRRCFLTSILSTDSESFDKLGFGETRHAILRFYFENSCVHISFFLFLLQRMFDRVENDPIIAPFFRDNWDKNSLLFARKIQL